jgi:hypothetical protein
MSYGYGPDAYAEVTHPGTSQFSFFEPGNLLGIPMSKNLCIQGFTGGTRELSMNRTDIKRSGNQIIMLPGDRETHHTETSNYQYPKSSKEEPTSHKLVCSYLEIG